MQSTVPQKRVQYKDVKSHTVSCNKQYDKHVYYIYIYYTLYFNIGIKYSNQILCNLANKWYPWQPVSPMAMSAMATENKHEFLSSPDPQTTVRLY